MPATSARLCLPLLGLLGLATVAGCQSGADSAKPDLVPVKGKILVGKAAPVGALVTFHPDTSKGNTARGMPMGKVRADGQYELVTGANPGAPLGWYRVTLTAFAAPGGTSPARPPRIDPKFAQLDKTTLSIEIVADPSPGQYDLRLTK